MRSDIEETPSPLRGTPPIFASFHSAKSEGELALSISDFVDWGTWSVGGEGHKLILRRIKQKKRVSQNSMN